MNDKVGMSALRDLCLQLRNLQAEKVALEEDLKDLNRRIEILQMHEMPDMMNSLGLRNATFEGIGRVQLAADIYASTREGQRDAAIQWLRDLGYGDMVQETYNASSLKALFRRQLADGIEIPDELFNVHPFTRASIVKA